MDQSPDRKARPSKAVTTLYLSAGMARSVAVAHLGPDEIGRTSLSSPFVIKTFLKQHAGLATEFLGRVGIDADALLQALDAPHDPEAQPEPRKLPDNPTEEQRNIHRMMKEMEDERREKGEPEPFTRPLKEAMRSARNSASATGDETYGVGAVVAALFETESISRDALFAVANPARIEEALQWLRAQPDQDDGPDFLATNKVQMREALDRMWPKLREQSASRTNQQAEVARDRHYEEDPGRYEMPLNIAERLSEHTLDAEKDFTWRVGVCLHAAGNEARRRRAPETTLDHMFFALLRDGTDTAAFLDRRGINRGKWAARLDAELPRFEDGPRWPPNDRSLGMSIPSNVGYDVKPLPPGLKLEDLPKDKRSEYVTRTIDTDRIFTDLVLLRNVHNEPQTIAFSLFEEAGITLDDLKAEIRARECGDPDWWRKAPDLVAKLASVENSIFRGSYQQCMICEEAAQYEARMRGASKVEFDDVLVALLIPGTDLASLAESLGLSVENLRSEVDAVRPRAEVHCMYPTSDDLCLGLAVILSDRYSDLLFLDSELKAVESLPTRVLSPGLVLLAAHGIDRPAIHARLAELGVELKH